MFLSLLLFCLTIGVYWLHQRTRNGPPPLPGMLPIVGHMFKLMGDGKYLWTFINKTMAHCLNSGSIYSLWIGPKRIYIIIDPDDATVVVNSYFGKAYIYNFAKSWLGNGLITADVPLWKKHRKLLNPTMNKQLLESFIDVHNRKGLRLVELLYEKCGKGPFDHTSYFRRVTLESICCTALGVDMDDVNNGLIASYIPKMQELLHLMCQRFQKSWLHLDFMWNLSKNKQQERALTKGLSDISTLIIKMRRNALELGPCTNKKTGRPCTSFLDMLLEMETLDSDTLTEMDIRNHVDTIIMAGHDSTASTLNAAMVLVGSHKHVQDRIHAELDEIFGNSERNVEKEDLPRLIYMEAVIKETLRIYCPVPAIARVLQNDLKLKNYTLESGSPCMILIHGIHHHPMWGDDVYEFKPERWLDPKTLPNNPNAFFAFSLGRRSCFGKIYAMMATKIMLCQVMRNFSVKGDHRKMKMKVDVFLKPVSGHHISIEKRS